MLSCYHEPYNCQRCPTQVITSTTSAIADSAVTSAAWVNATTNDNATRTVLKTTTTTTTAIATTDNELALNTSVSYKSYWVVTGKYADAPTSGFATADFPHLVVHIFCILLRRFNLSLVLFHHIHKPPFWPSPFPISWQLHPQHPSPNIPMLFPP